MGYRGELLIIFKNRTSRDLVHAVSTLAEIVDKLREHMHLPDSMIGNARLKLNNVRATTTNILGKLSTPPYNCDGKDRFIYHTGLAFNIGDDANGEPNEMSLRPRSNLTKSDFYMPNAPGTLDYKNY